MCKQVICLVLWYIHIQLLTKLPSNETETSPTIFTSLSELLACLLVFRMPCRVTGCSGTTCVGGGHQVHHQFLFSLVLGGQLTCFALKTQKRKLLWLTCLLAHLLHKKMCICFSFSSLALFALSLGASCLPGPWGVACLPCLPGP